MKSATQFPFTVVLATILLTLGAFLSTAQAWDRPTTIAAKRLEESVRKLHSGYRDQVGERPVGHEQVIFAAICELRGAVPDFVDDIDDDVPINRGSRSFRDVEDAMRFVERAQCGCHLKGSNRKLWDQTRSAWKQVSTRIEKG